MPSVNGLGAAGHLPLNERVEPRGSPSAHLERPLYLPKHGEKEKKDPDPRPSESEEK